MPEIYSDDRLYERLLNLLEGQNSKDRVYVYRLDGDRKIKPALFKGRPFPELENFLSDKHNGGVFHVMIRRGETMLLSGTIRLSSPLGRPSV